MTKPEALTLWRAFLCLVLVAVVLLLNACTYVAYKSEDRSLTVIDLHPTDNAISLSGILDGTGSIDVNREQGGTEGVIGEVGGIVNANPLD